jgi:hypothetical protein
VTKIINLYCEGMILHVHKDKTDEMNLQSVARDFCSETRTKFDIYVLFRVLDIALTVVTLEFTGT